MSRFFNSLSLSIKQIWSGLRFRLLFMVITMALLSLVAASVILFSVQRSRLIETGRASAASIGGLVEHGFRHAMLSNDWSMIDDLMRLAVQEPGVSSLRIINLQGQVKASSNPAEIGRIYKIEDQLCQECHASGSVTAERIGVLAPETRQQVMYNANLIQNEPDCTACHAAGQPVLGLLLIETPLTLTNQQLANGFWQTVLIMLVASALLVGLLVPVLNKYVIRPVGALSRGVDALTAGNLDYEVKTTNQDELGKLAESFDLMRRRLKETYTELDKREKEAVTLYQLGTKISASLSLSHLMDSVAEAACELLGVDVGMVGLFDEETKEIIMQAAAGVKAEAHKGIRMPVSPGTPGSALLEGRSIIAEAIDQNNLLHPNNTLIAEERIVSILAIPLHYGDQFMGVIEVMSRDRRQFNEADARLLMRMAQIVVISIENAQLYHQLRYMATLEERDRLAREMHDDLAQVLGYLNVRGAMVEDLLNDGQLAQARESLDELRLAAKRAYTNVREEIFNLRTSITPRIGLLPTLRTYLTEYQTHYGLETKLVFESEALTEFPSEVANQLLRIIQEALTNVRKHAQANEARICFLRERDMVCIQVEDNGKGFDPDHTSGNGRQSYGLQIMRERAESIGGSLGLVSHPGQGTRVIVYVPINSRN